MANPIIISESVHVSIGYSFDFLAHSIGPFMMAASSRLAAGSGLEAAILEAVDLFPDSARYFTIEPGRISETFGLRSEYLFGTAEANALSIASPSANYKIELVTPSEDLPELQRLLELCSSGNFGKAEILSAIGSSQSLFRGLLKAGILVEKRRGYPELAPNGVPGIYRLQHASLLYRSANTGILVDPHLHSSYGAGIVSDLYRDALQGKVDAILISHSHLDHWSLSTLMMFPRETPIVVPKVPAPTIICSDMAGLLRACGFTRVIAVDWYSEPLHFGDIDVHVLPFYGEQPLRFEAAKHPDIRNWGNTYLIRTSAYSSWFLIDSGDDALGCMRDVAHTVVSIAGHVDFILSNLRRFAIGTPQYINGGLNWLTLSPRHIREFAGMRHHVITLGPPGVAEICRIVNARVYLPYAHWWGELGQVADSTADTPDQSEMSLITELAEEMKKIGASTQILPWKIGDGCISCQNANYRIVPLTCSR